MKTLKQYRLIEGIKESIKNNTNESLRDIAINKAGYGKGTRNMYRQSTKRHILEELSKLGYSKEDLRRRFELGAKMTLEKGDFTNYLRANEDIARMEGQFLDKTENKTTITDERRTELLELSKRINLSPTEN